MGNRGTLVGQLWEIVLARLMSFPRRAICDEPLGPPFETSLGKKLASLGMIGALIRVYLTLQYDSAVMV